MKIGICGPISLSELSSYLGSIYDENSDVKGLGGAQVNILVSALLNEGYAVSVFTLDKEVRVGEEKILRADNLTIYIGPFRRNKQCVFDFQKKERDFLKSAICQDKPDIVHAHWTYEFAAAAIASEYPHLISVRDWAPKILVLMPKPYRLMRFIMNFYVLFKGKHFVANSLYIDEKILRLIRHKKSDLIPNSIQDESFLRRSKEINENPIILSINNSFGKLKNVSTLIESFSQVVEVIPNAKLYLVGENFEQGGKANIWASERGLEHNVKFIGAITQSEVLEVLENVDLLVHPSLEESFGNILIEAMAKKTPVIAGKNSGAVPWVLNNGQAGELVNITSKLDISSKIIELLMNPEKWKSIQKRGWVYAFDTFRTSVILKRFEKLYSEILY